MMPRNGQTGCRPSIRAGCKVKERKNKKERKNAMPRAGIASPIVARRGEARVDASEAKRSKVNGSAEGKKRASPVGSDPEVNPPAAPKSTDARSSRKIKIRSTGKKRVSDPPIEGYPWRRVSNTEKALKRDRARRRRRAIQLKQVVPHDGMQIPRSFDPLIANNICQRYADGEPMLAILSTKGYPRGGTFYLWTETLPELQKRWEAARRARAHSLAEETLTISDQSLDGHPAFIPAHALRVKTRQWLAAKARPDTYGEQIDLKHSGSLSIAALSSALRTVNPPTLIDGKTGKTYQDPDQEG